MSAAQPISRKGWALYVVLAILWGIPYLFIKVAVESIEPPAIVAGRTLIGAVVLLPFAIRSGALRVALRHWPWVLAFGLVEMAVPFVLLGYAEQQIPSGLTGLLVAAVPLFATIIAFLRGDRSVMKPVRLIGLAVGFVGLAIIVVGPGVTSLGVAGMIAIGQVLIVAIFYAAVLFIMAEKLHDVPPLGSITLSLLMIGIGYLPFALLTQREVPTAPSLWSLIALGVLCTALAFLGLFALVKEVGAVNAPLFTYANPIVAIVLGVILLQEPLGPGLLVGAPIVLFGCWLAATGGKLRVREAPGGSS